MASGLPCVVTNIRGNRDLIKNKDMLCELNKLNHITNTIMKIMKNALYKETLINENKKNDKRL